jgi:ATP-binding cassette subfamily F protein uup
MLQPASVLVLDEPTNDLDLDTLNVLEDALRDFSGAVILVTHDRFFMDQVCTEILAFARDINAHPTLEKFADYLQWEAWNEQHRQTLQQAQRAAEKKAREEAKAGGKKLSFKEKFELENMEGQILNLENELEKLQAESQTPEVASHATRLQELFSQIAEKQSVIDGLYARWAELEAKAKGS